MAESIGVVSDTHGLVRPEALDALAGVSLILHAGDVGKPEVLEQLATVAPVAAVRGNVDRGAWAESLPETDLVEHAGRSFYLIHDVHTLDLDPRAADIDVVVSGHSHQPGIREERGVLYLNPGSIGPRRFTLPIALARLRITDDGLTPELVELEIDR